MKIVEITGIPGVGKSYFVDKNKLKPINVLYDNDLIKKFNLTDIKLFFIFFKCKKPISQLKIILKIAVLIEFSFFDTINFVRNTIKKIGKNTYYLSINNSETVIIDEGISHLYFNVVSVNKNVNKKINILLKALLSYNDIGKIIIIDDKDLVIKKRLFTRGHKRVSNVNDAERFVENCRLNLKLMKENLDTTTLINGNGIDFEILINN